MNSLLGTGRAPIDALHMSTSKILLIDDDPSLLVGLSEMLHIRLGSVQVDTCLGPSFAVHMLQQKQYDLILCDVSMPEINGLDLLPKLRKAAPVAAIFMMSAALDSSVRTSALANGATGFIAKPFDRDALTFTLKQTLQNYRLPLAISASHAAV